LRDLANTPNAEVGRSPARPKALKICHIITRLVAGGAQRNTLSCALHQASAGHEVAVISGPETGSEGSLLEEAAAAQAYRLVLAPDLVREVDPRRDWRALLHLLRYLRAQRPDLVHTHTSKAGVLGRVAAKLARIPIVVHTPHGHVFHSYFSRAKEEAFKWCERALALAATDAIVMLSSGELEDHLREKIMRADQAVIIPSGVPLGDFLALTPVPAAPEPRLGYVGRLADIKGPLDLIRAFALVLDKRPGCRLTIVGDGPLRGEVGALIRELRMDNEVEILGWQSDTRAHLQAMDMLIVPSHNEGMGRVVVEAMAAGLPVVATAVGGLVDLVQDGHTGRLVAPHRPDLLAATILQVLELPDRGRSMGENGRMVAPAFGQDVMFSRLDELYARLARRRVTRIPPGARSGAADSSVAADSGARR
jgi:glycosyltransferase involved in cell wall biosynthesis